MTRSGAEPDSGRGRRDLTRDRTVAVYRGSVVSTVGGGRWGFGQSPRALRPHLGPDTPAPNEGDHVADVISAGRDRAYEWTVVAGAVAVGCR